MKIYQYHKTTKEFISEREARPNPREKGKFLIPAHSTTDKPPKTSSSEKAYFRNGSWEVEKIKTPKPSKYHKWTDDGWIISSDDQVLLDKDIADAEELAVLEEDKRKKEELIYNKIRELAIKELKLEGKLDENYK